MAEFVIAGVEDDVTDGMADGVLLPLADCVTEALALELALGVGEARATHAGSDGPRLGEAEGEADTGPVSAYSMRTLLLL